jgi:hypothetical protein
VIGPSEPKLRPGETRLLTEGVGRGGGLALAQHQRPLALTRSSQPRASRAFQRPRGAPHAGGAVLGSQSSRSLASCCTSPPPRARAPPEQPAGEISFAARQRVRRFSWCVCVCVCVCVCGTARWEAGHAMFPKQQDSLRRWASYFAVAFGSLGSRNSDCAFLLLRGEWCL